MSFVVVALLVQPEKVHCVVPEEYIHGLAEIQADLKNWGVDKRHNNLIFWSKNLLDDDVEPNATLQPPKWDLDISNKFPPSADSACYYGRIKRFYSKCSYFFQFLS